MNKAEKFVKRVVEQCVDPEFDVRMIAYNAIREKLGLTYADSNHIPPEYMEALNKFAPLKD